MLSLENEVLQAKERYQATVSSTSEVAHTLSALPQFQINDKFTLNQDEAWYTLAIEIQAPIETVMLQVSEETYKKNIKPWALSNSYHVAPLKKLAFCVQIWYVFCTVLCLVYVCVYILISNVTVSSVVQMV